MHFFQGYITGLATAFIIGPVFFMMLTSSLNFGARYGFAVAFGIFISDILCVTLSYFGIAKYINHDQGQFWIALAGAALLIFLGVKYLFFTKIEISDSIDIKVAKWSTFFIRGFLVNFVNPTVFMIWLGIIELGEAKTDTDFMLFTFLAAVTLGIFSGDLVKVFLAKSIRKFVNAKILKWIYRVSGIVMIAFGIRLILLNI